MSSAEAGGIVRKSRGIVQKIYRQCSQNIVIPWAKSHGIVRKGRCIQKKLAVLYIPIPQALGFTGDFRGVNILAFIPVNDGILR